MSRHPILPGCSQSDPGTHGLPLRHAPASVPKGNLLGSSALPVQLHVGPARHRSLFQMAKCAAVCSTRGAGKCYFTTTLLLLKELDKWLSAMCWSDRASLLTLLSKRLVREHLLLKEGERQALIFSSIPNQQVLFLVLTGIEFPISQPSSAVLCAMFL